MNFRPFDDLQYYELISLVILFLIFIGFLRTIILNQDFDSKNIIFLTILFGLWLFFVKFFTNSYIYFSSLYKMRMI